jgi:hypothetical protein
MLGRPSAGFFFDFFGAMVLHNPFTVVNLR